MQFWRILTLATLLAPSLFAQIGASAGELKDSPSWPEVWGDLGLQGYASGERMAPNGVVFDPIFKSNFNLNLGLLPWKKLYVFLETEFWMQRSSPGVTNDNQGIYDFSKREFDINTGLAWNVFDRLELRASVDALSNLNRGTSRTKASGYEDGGQLEARYYFGPANTFDIGRLNFVGIGYYPAQSFIGGDGSEFRAGMFAQAYAAWNIPALRSYLYGHARFIQEEYGSLRLITFDAGIAARPFSRVQNLEFRLGNELTADVDADTTRDLIYAAIRVYYGPSSGGESKDVAGQIHERNDWPEIWGDFGLSIYAAGDRMAPNGVQFDPIFKSDFNVNVGILSKKKLYLFVDNEFWVQRASAAGPTVLDPANNDFSQREYNFHSGLAWNVFSRFEVRGSVYALNNLNRGGSAAKPPSKTFPSGYQDGTQVELRYYLDQANIYDLGRLGFVSIGYYPSQTLIGGDGVGFHPGFFARAHGSYGIPKLRSYLYGDGKFIAQKSFTARLITFDAGWATRPFSRFENLEFRLGNELTTDVEADTTRDLTYGAIRINFSTR